MSVFFFLYASKFEFFLVILHSRHKILNFIIFSNYLTTYGQSYMMKSLNMTENKKGAPKSNVPRAEAVIHLHPSSH